MAKELDKERYIVLRKGDAELIIDKVGAQIVSYKINGVELMYQGAIDPEHHAWKKTAIVLAPNPGPMVSVTKFQKRDETGVDHDEKGKLIYHYEGLPSVVITDKDGEKKTLYVKEVELDNKKQIVYVDKNGLMYNTKGQMIYDYQDLRSVVVGVDENGNKKNFYVKQLKKKVNGKTVKEIIYVDRDGNALDNVDITFCENGETLITDLKENKTYKIGKKPTVFVEYVHNGGYYYMTQHGFIQSTKFRKMGQTEDSCVLGTRSGDDTTSEYPYDFNFAAVYSLGEQGQLETKFALNNKGKQTMLGGIGWHPAFQLHDHAGKYRLVLNEVFDEKGDPIPFGEPYYEEDKETKKTVRKKIEAGQEIDINEFVVGSHITRRIKGIKTADVTLVYYPEDGAEPVEYIRMRVTSPDLVLWTHDDESNMIAIEPWSGGSRSVGQIKNQHDIEQEEDAPTIKAGETKELDASVAIGEDYLQVVKKRQTQGTKISR